jgi:hypothetical protein
LHNSSSLILRLYGWGVGIKNSQILLVHVTGSDLCNRALASWSGELEPIAEAKFSGSKCWILCLKIDAKECQGSCSSFSQLWFWAGTIYL